MDTIVNFVKKLARKVLKKELDVATYRRQELELSLSTAIGTIHKLRSKKEAAEGHIKRWKESTESLRAELYRAQRDARCLQEQSAKYYRENNQRLQTVSKAKDWAIKNLEDSRRVQCLFDAITFTPGYGNVHPFDRWDINPKL